MKTDFQWTKRLAPRDGPILFLAQLLLAFSAILWIFLETEELRFLIGEDFPQDYVASELWLEGRSVYGPEVADRARTSCGFDGIK
ncbi:MAG: hypothetical protein HKO65_01625, partial [Gemmatimonadetes bacterium]|nr:hypothetical protein [Gemmatimonadota bacterium]